MRGRFQTARERAFAAYEAKYGERHRRDPRGPRPGVILGGTDPALEQWVADVLRARNDGVSVVPPLP